LPQFRPEKRVDAFPLPKKSYNIYAIYLPINDNGLHMACGGFEALSCPPKPKLAAEREQCWQPFTRHKLYALLNKSSFVGSLILSNLGGLIMYKS
jgi:hypothetical protein